MNRTLTELGSKIVSLIFVYPPSPSPLLHFEIHCHFILPSPRVLEKYYSMVFTSVSHRLRKTCKTWKREIFSKFRVFVENVLCLQCRCKLRYRKVPKVTLRTTLGLSGLLLPPDPIASLLSEGCWFTGIATFGWLKRVWYTVHGPFKVTVLLGSFSNDDGDRNENGKKSDRLINRLEKQQFCTCMTLFWYISSQVPQAHEWVA